MEHIKRAVIMHVPTVGSIEPIYLGAEGKKFIPQVGEKVILIDVSGSEKKFATVVVSRDANRGLYNVLVKEPFEYEECK